MRIPKLNLTASVSGAIAVAIASVGVATPAFAQQLQRPLNFIFEDVTLSPGFDQDPVTIHGISGGPLTASELAERNETPTGPCLGFVDREPDHTMVLQDFFNYLRLQVQSSEDTTLVIRGPGGTWCNDDYTDMNPGIAGQWLSGTYHIWVGSYERENYHPYVIRISETQ